MHDLFKVHRLSDYGVRQAERLAEEFSDLLDNVEHLCGTDGREMAIVRTKLQEACYHAKRALCSRPEVLDNDAGNAWAAWAEIRRAALRFDGEFDANSITHGHDRAMCQDVLASMVVAGELVRVAGHLRTSPVYRVTNLGRSRRAEHPY